MIFHLLLLINWYLPKIYDFSTIYYLKVMMNNSRTLRWWSMVCIHAHSKGVKKAVDSISYTLNLSCGNYCHYYWWYFHITFNWNHWINLCNEFLSCSYFFSWAEFMRWNKIKDLYEIDTSKHAENFIFYEMFKSNRDEV